MFVREGNGIYCIILFGSNMQFQGKIKYQLFRSTTAVIDSNKKKTLNLPLIYKIYFQLLNETFLPVIFAVHNPYLKFPRKTGFTRIQRSPKICTFLLLQHLVASFPCTVHLETYWICSLSSSIKQPLLSCLILYEHCSSMLAFSSASLSETFLQPIDVSSFGILCT